MKDGRVHWDRLWFVVLGVEKFKCDTWICKWVTVLIWLDHMYLEGFILQLMSDDNVKYPTHYKENFWTTDGKHFSCTSTVTCL